MISKLLSICLLIVAAVTIYFTSVFLVSEFETRTEAELSQALAASDNSWLTPEADGNLIHLKGEAPDDHKKSDGLQVIANFVDTGRLVDEITIKPKIDIPPPEFSIEILKSPEILSLIGIVPVVYGKDYLQEKLSAALGENGFTDMTETADFPAPENWQKAVDTAIAAIQALPNAKISLTAEQIAVSTVVDNAEDRLKTEAMIMGLAKGKTKMVVDIAAPRPVISPYKAVFKAETEAANFTTCMAETEEDTVKILAAAKAYKGFTKTECQIALGAPDQNWADHIAFTLKTMEIIGGGEVEFVDFTLKVTAIPGTDPERFAEFETTLKKGLSEGRVIELILPPDPNADLPPPAQFTLNRADDGTVTLSGDIQDETAQQAVLTYTQSLFRADKVDNQLTFREGLPASWSLNILAGIEAAKSIETGTLNITETNMVLSGESYESEIEQRIEADIKPKLADKVTFKTDIQTLEIPATEKIIEETSPEEEPEAPVEEPKTPDICIENIQTILKTSKIEFDSGQIQINPESDETIDQIAAVLENCPDFPMEIAGYTDNVGKASVNKKLSEQRAQAVLSALKERGFELNQVVINGYGQENPIADNATAEGRAANRRIEFTLKGEN